MEAAAKKKIYNIGGDMDHEISQIILEEQDRQQNQIELIASENFASKAVIQTQGSCLTNKYAEGYPGKRYYGGCEIVDKAEELAKERIKELFECSYANVQPHSGSQANQAVFLATLKPGDKMLGMDLAGGGHLTHGAKPNLSGKWFEAHHYGVCPETHLINYDEVMQKAKEIQPKMIICGASAYSQHIDFAYFRKIADEVGAYLLADVAHYSGLIAAKEYPTPVPYADFITSTTHKTLRGPRGGIILSNNLDYEKKLNSAVFPGLQGGPLMHVIAAKAVAFYEALQPEFKTYQQQVIKNAKALCKSLQSYGLNIITNGTECHLALVDLRPKNISGKDAEHILEMANITCNKNSIPYDEAGPVVTSGIRIGTAAMTTRGFQEAEFELVGQYIAEILDAFHLPDGERNAIVAKEKEKVIHLCEKYPLY